MASLIYDSALYDLVTGAIDSDNDTFKALLVTSSYTPNKGTHLKRSDVTNESSGTGYTTGGTTVTCTVAKNATTHVVTLTFSAASWATSSITARGAVYYKSRGGASSADELIGYNDFTVDKTSAGGTFSVAASVLTISNT
jgi:hypothetical protein